MAGSPTSRVGKGRSDVQVPGHSGVQLVDALSTRDRLAETFAGDDRSKRGSPSPSTRRGRGPDPAVRLGQWPCRGGLRASLVLRVRRRGRGSQMSGRSDVQAARRITPFAQPPRDAVT
jgi:hypothetical protein